MKLKTFASVCTLFVLLVTAKTQASEGRQENGANHQKAAYLVSEIAHVNIYRVTSDSLDQIFSKYCTKAKARKELDAVFVNYKCESSSKIDQIELISIEPSKGQNYLLELTVRFAYGEYQSVRNALESNLGKPFKSAADFSEWRHTKDSGLNTLGNPKVLAVRNRAKGTAKVVFSIEQGDK